MNPFREFLQRGGAAGGFGTDDVLSAVLPLFEEISRAHQAGQVVPLDGGAALLVEESRLRVAPGAFASPRRNTGRVDELQRLSSTAIEVIGNRRLATDLDEGRITDQNLQVGAPGEVPTGPVFLPGYVAWEQACGHHDELTDIHCLGLVLASLACSLDVGDADDLRLFAAGRTNLFGLNERLHPVIAGVIVQMTELNRHRRVQTLEVVIQRLRHYRDQVTDYAVDFAQLKGFREAAPRDRSQIILSHLRNRLFEISRRNRLIHFRTTQQMLNLTLASVPLLLDHRNIQAEQLFIWHDKLAAALAGGESINLGQYVRFEDAPYASDILDQIITTERRDRNEFGFAQLRLVICFLHWHNLKDFPEERVHSPLLLLPVELVRKKGVRDAYVLKALTSEAEVNPALRHYLNQLYGLNLPASVDLAETTLPAFHQLLATQIQASEPGVTLRKVDRPQIEFIHEKARQRLDQFRRKQRLAARTATPPVSVDYSYDRERFRPLGLQLFLNRVKPAPLPFAQAAGRTPVSRQPNLIDPGEAAAPGPGSFEVEKQMFAVKDQEQGGNPYEWDFDLCTQTLGNFNYRKMSLVRDYATLLDRGKAGPAFDAIFSTQPKTATEAPVTPGDLAAQFPVVDCDPTQTLAVSRARGGGSYIIQGPPGTGKSQTITNLIADYVARGQRVLFVCEKRAAIDVVFHRLGRQGLDELCCLIHDSQTDKREFIRNLKQTYEKFLQQPVDETLETRRTDLLRLMTIELDALASWNEVLTRAQPAASFTVRDLLNRLIELRGAAVELDALTREQVPGYEQWPSHAGLVRSLSAALVRIRREPCLARHPFRHLSAQALHSPQPLAAITSACDDAAQLLRQILAAVESLQEAAPARTLDELRQQVAFASQVAELAGADALELLNPRSARSKQLAKVFREWRQAQAELEQARAANAAWRTKLSETDTATALTEARAFEGSLFRWFSPSFWRLRKLLQASYDFSGHALPPPWSQILARLAAEHTATAAASRADQQVGAALGEIDRDLAAGWIESPAERLAGLPEAARALQAYLVENPEATMLVENLAALTPTLQRLCDRLALVHTEAAGLELAAIGRELQALRQDLAWLPDLVPLLTEVLRLPEELQRALRRLPLSDRQLEQAMASQSYATVVRHEQAFAVTDGGVLAGRIARLNAHHREWLKVNALCLHQKVRREFLRKVQLSSLPASQLNGPAEKEFKKRYATGRRELEHEFSKTMRHRSIRDLADDETGEVLRDLKPVWLMSPLSVSDTLPLASDTFDVVIFDEASQILMEEAVPAVARARQIIVVGDEMQLPPTNFFSASRNAEEEDGDDADPAGPLIEDLDAESFLTQSARNLPATMLGWHYRSRSESLISYSNHAFYEGRLLTVPDRRLASRSREEIRGGEPGDAGQGVHELLARGVSFHFLGTAVYENRRNPAEAVYIAGLLRGLLAREDRPSIGIVAFSEAQQGEIESAITRLGGDDADFRNRVENEYEREDEGQFNGLFVKNLENVQGDERDIIILSICYGHDRNRRMLMNFGPINQRGGEKRLNVIFSRARKHMAVVSSIRHHDITNDHNDGAACLRNFLEYAAASSVGDHVTAHRVLRAAVAGEARPPGGDPHETIARELGAALQERGWQVEHDVGQSSFRLPLAVRAREGETHALGVLLDDPAHYAQANLLERYLQRPGVLRAFGWKLASVYAKDWLQDPATVLRRLEELLAGGSEPELAPVEIALPPVPVVPLAPLPPPPPADEPAPPPAEVAPVAVPGAAGPLRRFVCVEDGAQKFWEAGVQGMELTVRFGRLGTKGQTQTRAFGSAEGARKEQDKLIRSKLAKGYSEEPPEPAP